MPFRLNLLPAIAALLVLPGVLPAFLLLPERSYAQTRPALRKESINDLTQQGAQYYQTGRYQEALESFQRALALVRATGELEGQGSLLNNIGLIYDVLGQYDQAIATYTESLAVSRELGDRSGEGLTLNNIGLMYFYQGQYPQALSTFEAAMAVYEGAGDRAGIAQILNSRGLVYSTIGQYEQAIAVYTEALTIRQALGDRGGVGQSLTNLGAVYERQGQYEQALSLYEESLAIRRELGDRRGEGTTLNNMGLVYQYLGQYEQAIAVYTESLAISREMGNRYREGTGLSNLGSVYQAVGQYEQAIAAYTEALAIQREVGDRSGQSTALNNLGGLYIRLGQYEEAIAALTESLEIIQAIGDRSNEGGTLNNLGSLHLYLEQYDQALSYFTEALAIQQEIGDRAGTATTLNNMGMVLDTMGEPELAIVFLKQAVNQWEAIRGDIRGLSTEQQQSFTDRVSFSYRQLADLLLQANRIPEAQRVLDLLRVQELDEYLQDVRSTEQTEEGVDYWAIEQDLLVLYQQVLDEAEELRQLQEKAQTQGFDALSSAEQQRLSDLQARSGDVQELFFAFRDRPEVNSAITRIRETTQGQNLELDSYAQLQDELQALPERTVVLYPLILEDRLELVLVFPDAPPLRYPVPVTGENLNRAIVDFGQALTDPTSDVEPLAQQLYTWLIEPMEETLAQQGIESIIYSPDGALRYIPLAALHDGETYLIQRFSISHITADSLTDFADAPTENQRLLAAACAECAFRFEVAQNPFQFGDLPYTETEVNNLAAHFPDTNVLVNQDFSLNALQSRLSSYGLIHLATHAAFVTNAPQESFLVLGSGERVSLQDIRRRWNLSHVGLVVLSACETAVGSTELGSGIEFLGLGYQLQSSGAQAVMASLWRISDGGTQVLMDAFYAALNNGYSKAEALQRAQMALITSDESILSAERRGTTAAPADYEITDLRTGQPLAQSTDLAHPYYWAPFILIGNGR